MIRSVPTMDHSAGFTALPVLLALSVVVISGVIAAALIAGQDQLVQREQQQRDTERVEQALMGFVMRESRLPCPDTTNNGQENCPSQSAPSQRVGAVPYRTLGLPAQSVLNLTYAPHIGTAPAGNLTDAEETDRADVVRVKLPGGIPDLGSFTITEDRSAPSLTVSQENQDDLLALLVAQKSYDDFLSRLISNNPPAVNINGGAVGNSLTASSGNYINALQGDLSPTYAVPNNALSFEPGKPAFDDLLGALSDLVIYQRSLDGKGRIFRDEFDLRVIVSDLSMLSADTSKTESTKNNELSSLVSRWQSSVNAHNTQVGTINGSFGVSNSTLNAHIMSNPARPSLSAVVATAPVEVSSGSFADRRDAFETLLGQSLDGISANFRSLEQAVTDSDAVSRAGGGSGGLDPSTFDPATANPDDFDPDQFSDATITTSNRIADLVVDYGIRLDNVIARIAVVEGLIAARNDDITSKQAELDACLADEDCPNLGTLQSQLNTLINQRNTLQAELNNLKQLEVLYGRLVQRLGFLNDDLFCRAVNDGQCVLDSVQQAYLDAIDQAGEALTGGGFERDQTVPDQPDPAGDLSAQETADFSSPSQTITVSAANYPTLVNLADFCFKLDSLMGRSGVSVSPRVGYKERVGASEQNRVAAFVLVEHGNNQRADGPNQFPANPTSAVFFARPDQPHGLFYDDRVRPMTPERMSIMLACPALLQSYESFANTAEEINLLYIVAKGALDSAQQDVITSSITLALAIIRLAVDTAAIIKDTATGVAATAKCVASLGFAVNACIAAGFAFSAAVAHGATLVADATAIAMAGLDLDTAINDRSSARVTLQDTTAHFQAVVQAILDADSRGGVSDAMNNP